MKKTLLVIIIIIFVLLLIVGGIYFLSGRTLVLENITTKKDPLTNKNAVSLIADEDYDGLKRAGVNDKEVSMVIDFIVDASGAYDFRDIENSREQLRKAGVSDDEFRLASLKILNLFNKRDIESLVKIGLTEDKINTVLNNWDQKKAEDMIREEVQNRMKSDEEELEKMAENIGR